MTPSPPSDPRCLIAGALVFVTVVFQHFQIGSLGDYPVTVGLFSGLLLVLVVTRRLPYASLSVVWASLIALTSIAAITSGKTVGSDYFSTLALFLLSTFVVVCASGSISTSVVRSIAFYRGLFISLLVVAGMSIAQAISGFLGSGSLFNPFGQFQYLRLYNPQVGLVTYPRAHGFFLEPSYDAFVIGTVTVALLALGKRPAVTIALASAGLVACQSATGLLILVALFIIAVLRSSTKLFLLIVGVGSVVAVIAGGYLVTRLATITQDGTSANYRLLAPLQVLQDTLLLSPLGQPLGSVSSVLSTYRLQMAGVPASSLDNGFYVVVFYFGWVGLISLLVGLAIVARNFLIVTRADLVARGVPPIWLFASLSFSGGIMAPEFGLMTWLVVVCWRINQPFEGNRDEAVSTIDRRDSHLQGSARALEDD